MELEKGITLVSLVVTIIVILILSGVTLSLTLGQNGVITKAMEASSRMTAAQIEEEIRMSLMLNYVVDENISELREDLTPKGYTIEQNGTKKYIVIAKDNIQFIYDCEENELINITSNDNTLREGIQIVGADNIHIMYDFNKDRWVDEADVVLLEQYINGEDVQIDEHLLEPLREEDGSIDSEWCDEIRYIYGNINSHLSFYGSTTFGRLRYNQNIYDKSGNVINVTKITTVNNQRVVKIESDLGTLYSILHLPCVNLTGPNELYVVGDADMNYKITFGDAMLVFTDTAYNESRLSELQQKLGDGDMDGRTTAADASIIWQVSAWTKTFLEYYQNITVVYDSDGNEVNVTSRSENNGVTTLVTPRGTIYAKKGVF